jgi:hypothetical protein
MKYRFQWTFPIEISPHDPDTLYVCSNYVHRSTDDGATWETISPDLTRNDPERTQPSGGPITADNSGAEVYCTIFAFRESPHERGVFWAGSDDGVVHLSRDAGRTWKTVTPPDLPEWALISVIEPSPHDAATAYLAATRYKHDDLRPYLYKSTNYGATWTRITTGIPDHEFTRVIRADPNRRCLLYAGTETGIYVSHDDGGHWLPLQSNLPVAPIHDLVVKGTDLVAATHGRSFWILDDLTPLYQMDDATAEAAAKLFRPRDTVRIRRYGHGTSERVPGYLDYKITGPVTVTYRPTEAASGAKTEALLDAGTNPPAGVIIHYWLKEKPEGTVTIRILDAEGNTIRTLAGDAEEPPRPPAAAGANRIVWDMRYERPTKLQNGTTSDPYEQEAMAGTAPRALPGSYQVQLSAGDQTFTERFAILEDPRLTISADALKDQFTMKLAIRDRLSEVISAANDIRRVRKQVDAWEERAKTASGHDQLREAAARLKEHLKAAEESLVNLEADTPRQGRAWLREKLVTLSQLIDESDDGPTQGARELFARLTDDVAAARDRVRHLMDDDVRAFADLVRASDLPVVGP